MLNIIIVPCLNDNYSYVCYDEKRDAFVVDPSEFKPVHDCLENNNLNLKFVLNTHHHFDHVGGNFELKQKYNCKVVGSKLDEYRIPEIDIFLNDIHIVHEGISIPFLKEAVVSAMRVEEVNFKININQGNFSATAWGCDMTEEYVIFNSAYST